VVNFSSLSGGSGSSEPLVAGAATVGYRPSSYYTCFPFPNNPSTDTLLCAANTVYWTPIFVTKNQAFTRILYTHTGASESGRNFRFALYSNVNGRPNTKLIESISFSTTATVPTFYGPTTSFTLDRGWYWCALMISGNTITFAAIDFDANRTGNIFAIDMAGTIGSGGAAGTRFRALMRNNSTTYTAMPATADSTILPDSPGDLVVPLVVLMTAA
jgi:hypothetical protein